MTTIPDSLLDQAMQLAPEVRESLAMRLLESLEPVDDDCEAAWAAEIQRRLDDLRSGRETAIPLEEAWKIILDDSADDDDTD